MKCVLSLSLVLVLLAFNTSQAAPTISKGDVGFHNPVLLFEKDRNPENILVIYTKLNPDCSIVKTLAPRPAAQKPALDVYWLMAGQTFKPVNGIIKSKIFEGFQIQDSNNSNSFDVLLNNLEEVKTDLPSKRMTIQSGRVGPGKCDAHALFRLGASDQNAVLKLTSIYTETEGSKFSPQVTAITIKGINVETGRIVIRRYLAN